VINSDGSVAGWQDKEQIDASEELIYVAGEGGGCSGLAR
jgi:hypothetical protein